MPDNIEQGSNFQMFLSLLCSFFAITSSVKTFRQGLDSLIGNGQDSILDSLQLADFDRVQIRTRRMIPMTTTL